MHKGPRQERPKDRRSPNGVNRTWDEADQERKMPPPATTTLLQVIAGGPSLTVDI
jgi:hypothetical protein